MYISGNAYLKMLSMIDHLDSTSPVYRFDIENLNAMLLMVFPLTHFERLDLTTRLDLLTEDLIQQLSSLGVEAEDGNSTLR